MNVRVRELSPEDFAHRLARTGIGLRIGPFNVHLTVQVPGLAPALQALYGNYACLDRNAIYGLHVRLFEVRRWLPAVHRRVRFTIDGLAPHEDMPAAHALAVLEWGINLVLALRYHCFLMLHAAVLERHGRAVLLPAAPGSGKSTLCAAMMSRGWRLFSDEFGLVRPGSDRLVPVPRPVSLKNASIDVIRSFAPTAKLGPTIHNTRKGTVAHVVPPVASVLRADIGAPAAWIVFPSWSPDASLSFEPLPARAVFQSLVLNAFNYELLGEQAFSAIAQLVERTRGFRLVYSRLEEALQALDALADTDAA
jgi:HprK-related kinase A